MPMGLSLPILCVLHGSFLVPSLKHWPNGLNMSETVPGTNTAVNLPCRPPSETALLKLEQATLSWELAKALALPPGALIPQVWVGPRNLHF